METDLIIGFAVASAIIVLVPGPVVLLTVANAISYGARYGVATACSAGLAHATMLAVAAFGMTSVLTLMADWFDVIRWLGVAYLVFLGVQQFRAPVVALEDTQAIRISPKKLFVQAFIVAWTNPKTLIFYAAFFPQFIDPTKPFGPQMWVLCLVFMAVSLVLDNAYALAAGRVRPMLIGRRGAVIRNRLTGSLLMGAGLGLALVRKS